MQISHIFVSVQNLNETIEMQRFFGVLLISMILIGTGYSTNNARKVFNTVSTEGLSYDGTDIYYNGELAATLSSVEVAFDDGKVVREATFVLTSAKFNEKALAIIKFIQSKKTDGNWEVEVELKMNSIK